MEFNVAAVGGVCESEADGVQPLPVEPEACGQRRVGAVHGVAAAGVVQRGEVDADLVGAAGFQVYFQQRCLTEGFECVVVGDGVLAVSGHGESPAC